MSVLRVTFLVALVSMGPAAALPRHTTRAHVTKNLAGTSLMAVDHLPPLLRDPGADAASMQRPASGNVLHMGEITLTPGGFFGLGTQSRP